MEYCHGGDIYGEDHIRLDFSVNTNPLGMPESVRQAVISSAASWERYPDIRMRGLRDALSAFYRRKGHSFEAEDFICGNGAADLLYTLLYARRPKKALLFVPCFGEYEAALRAAGCQVEKIFLEKEKGFSMAFSEKEFEALLPENTDMIVLGNPNNPTGGAVRAELLRQWCGICRERGIFLVLDECFNWFLGDGEAHSAMAFLREFPNVFVLNAFTKIYAMAGLRLGYGICTDRAVIREMELCRQPWSVSAPAQTAGIQALKEEDFIRRTGETVKTERAFLTRELKKLDFQVYPSQVNYLLFSCGDGIDYADCLKRQGILIRSCQNFDGLDQSYYRISVKKRQENEILLNTLNEIRTGKKERPWQR